MDNCIFCKIIKGEIPSTRIYEDDVCIATLDINPAAMGHTLIIPREHHNDITDNMDEVLLGHLFKVAAMAGERQKERLGADGFNVLQNNGTAAGQSVRHLHIHVIPRFDNDGVLGLWKPMEPSMDELRAMGEKLS